MIISSFDSNGNIIRHSDSSIFLAFCHIDFDEDILKTIKLKYIINLHLIKHVLF